MDDKEQEIDDELLDLITNYERMKKEIIPKFEDLKIELEIDSDKDFAKYRKDRIEQQQAAKAMEAAAAAIESIDLNDVVDDVDIDDDDNDSDLDLNTHTDSDTDEEVS